jgi:hypothetical protein
LQYFNGRAAGLLGFSILSAEYQHDCHVRQVVACFERVIELSSEFGRFAARRNSRVSLIHDVALIGIRFQQ